MAVPRIENDMLVSGAGPVNEISRIIGFADSSDPDNDENII